ncbi:VanZ family protein [Desulfonatronum thioautotrophicum]|uniref:VanZ family protein n=1 Tax=Desulfonatronum thioautotrophicum TaxID=617001 RepID=UPI0005EBC570|nr:VanZ family protein [Desulfonatronum thioautotrophicum]
MQKALFLLIYIFLVFYGSLYPFTGWHIPQNTLWEHFFLWNTNKSDMLLNVLVYMPLGFLIFAAIEKKVKCHFAILISILLGSSISFCVEVIQFFLQHRITTISDWILNSLGSFLGSLFGLFTVGRSKIAEILHTYKKNLFHDHPSSNLGIFVLVLWTLSQLTPLVPSPSWSNIKEGLKPVWYVLQDYTLYDPLHAFIYTTNVLAICLVTILIAKRRKIVLAIVFLYIGCVMVLKVPIIGRQISLEALTGSIIGCSMAFFLCTKSVRTITILAAIMIITAFVVHQIRPGSHNELYAFNWVPFRSHMTPVGLINILGALWPFTALGFLAIAANAGWRLMVFCGFCVAALAFSTEWLQQYIPGRYPDITPTFLAIVGWFLAISIAGETAKKSGTMNVTA